jgi:phenylpyruvate tautomerase PptA (4-oxalocrotonate tautomerase family)
LTIVTVNAPEGAISLGQRAALATSLTDAVLEIEVGQSSTSARAGFQVWFRDFDPSYVAIGGRLTSKADGPAFPIHTDIAVMDGAWPQEDRASVIARVYDALTGALGFAEASPAWWVTFRVIDEGSWGARGRVLSVLDLLQSGVFTDTRAEAIRLALRC